MYATNKQIPVKKILSLHISFLCIFQPLIAADILIDTTHTHQNTSLDTAANGTSIVNISTPDTQGVSHNTYIQFNIPTQGTILNNSNREVKTQLAGYIYGNENVSKGSASLILNEVSGTNRSRLNGYLEVAGQSADVIVANPNGITVNGAGFINIPKATLTTGKVAFSGNRPLFDIEGGDIFIEGKGLDATETSSLELYTQAIKLNASLYAKDLRMVTGLNHIDAKGEVSSRDDAEKERPTFGIDSTALGGIYAHAISLVGTQKGVGVYLPSEMLVQDKLEISSDGKIVLGKVSVKNSANINSKSNAIEINEGIHANTLDLQALTDITLQGNIAAVSNITLQGGNLYNEALLAAGVNADLTPSQEGSLALDFTQSINHKGTFYTTTGIVNTGIFNNDNGIISATQMYIDTVAFNNANSYLYLNGDSVHITTSDILNNENGLISANGNLILDTVSLDNRNGDLEATDTLEITSSHTQIGGSRFFAENHLELTSDISTIDTDTKFLSADSMDLVFGGDLTHGGEILANGSANIKVLGDLHNERSITANHTLNIVANRLKNNGNDTGASIRGGGLSSLTLNGNLDNYGLITSSHDLDIVAHDISNYAAIAAASNLTLLSTNFYNTHTLVSGKDLYLYIENILRNNEDADIYAGNGLTIAKDITGAKTHKVENISGKIESGGNMRIVATDITNISATEITTTLEEINGMIDITCDIWESFSCPDKHIALEIDLMSIKDEIIQENTENGIVLTQDALQALLTQEMIKQERQAYILANYKETKTTADALYFYELTASLEKNEMIVKRTKPHKKEEFRKVDYTVSKESIDSASLANHKEGKIISGNDLNLDAETIVNKTSLITAGNHIDINGNVQNTSVGGSESIVATINYSWKHKSDGGQGQLPVSKSVIRDVQGVSSQILAGGTLSGNFGTLQNGMKADTVVNIQSTAPTISTRTQTLGVYDPIREGMTLPTNPYGLFVTNATPEGPLIESNPEYTNYNHFVSSDYLLERLGYDAENQMRRLGDAMYETQLIRDAVMAMRGERYIGLAQSDHEQYINLMNAGIHYAQESGLELGVPPSATQLKNLKEDLVWMEVKIVQGKQVLVPVLYLAQVNVDTSKANINAKNIELTVDGDIKNSGYIVSKKEMTLHTGTLTNVKGNIEAGSSMHLAAIGDLKNLSGKIKGDSVVLVSEQGSITNKTLSQHIDIDHRVGKEHYTLIDKTASMEATKGHLLLDAGQQIDNVAGTLEAKEGMLLQAKENINITTLKDDRAYDYIFDNGYAKGESLKHKQSKIKTAGQLTLVSGKSIDLEAASMKADDMFIHAKEKVNLTAVIDSTLTQSHVKKDGFLSSTSRSDMKLTQSVKGTEIETANLRVEGEKEATLESIRVNATNSAEIISKTGNVNFTAKSYTNARYHEESDSMLGGLISSRAVDEVSKTLLADSSASAESQIILAGKNINLVATDLETLNGDIKLSASENINIVSGMESQSITHIREESGINLGLSDGRLTFAEETKESISTTNHTNKASHIITNALRIESGKDSRVIASNITAAVMQVDAGREFNILSDKDSTSTQQAQSKKEIGLELTLNSEEASLFAGYWEDKYVQKQAQSQVAKSNIVAENLQVNAQNTNVVGSNITGKDISLNAKNIRILSDTTNTQTDAYTSSIKAGIEAGIKQNLSQAVNAIVEVGGSKSGSAVAARSLQAYDAVESFAQQPVTAGVNVIYEEANTNAHSSHGNVVASSITATNVLTLHAKNEVEIAGSEVGSANALTLNAENIHIYATEGTYGTKNTNDSKNAQVGLYGTHIGQATVGYQENEMTSEGIYQRNSQLYAGGKATLTSTKDTTLAGANIEAKNLELQVGEDLYMQSLQERKTIEGSNTGGSISGSVIIGIPTGVSANAGQTSGERAWVSQTTGINANESMRVNVAGTTTLTGASITNIDKHLIDQENLELHTKHLVVHDIKDIDTYEASSTGVGLGSNDGTPSLNSVAYTNNTKDKEQITRSTIGGGNIHTQTMTGTLNRDTTKTQQIIKDEASNTEIYLSNKSLELLDDPNTAIDNLGQKLKDVGQAAHVEILENLPSASKGKDEKSDFIDNTIGVAIDAAGEYSFGVIPTVGNGGGYITQLAINVVGDNKTYITVNDENKLRALGITKKRDPKNPDTNWDYEAYTNSDGSVVYKTNPKKTIRIDEPRDKNHPLDKYKIHVSSQDVKTSGINSVFTNGLNNKPDEALVNQQTQQGIPEIGLVNYNTSHGTLADLIETGLEKTTIALDAIPGVQEIGYLINGSARQTGETIAQISQINGGNVNIAAHSQGTQQTYLGIQQHQEELAEGLQANKNAIFTLQNAGSPVTSEAAQDLIVNGVYGGIVRIQEHIDKGTEDDVFRSQVNPGDPVGMLGGNFGGVNNNAPFTSENFWSQIGYTLTRGVPTLTDSSTSPHSGYGCIIGCGENGVTGKKDEIYVLPIDGFRPLIDFYKEINVDGSRSNVHSVPSGNAEEPKQIGIGANK